MLVLPDRCTGEMDMHTHEKYPKSECQLITLGLYTFEQNVNHFSYSFACNVQWFCKANDQLSFWSSLSIYSFILYTHKQTTHILYKVICCVLSSFITFAHCRSNERIFIVIIGPSWCSFHSLRFFSLSVYVCVRMCVCVCVCCGNCFWSFWHFVCIWLAPLMFIDSISKCLSNTCFMFGLLLVVYSLSVLQVYLLPVEKHFYQNLRYDWMKFSYDWMISAFTLSITSTLFNSNVWIIKNIKKLQAIQPFHFIFDPTTIFAKTKCWFRIENGMWIEKLVCLFWILQILTHRKIKHSLVTRYNQSTVQLLFNDKIRPTRYHQRERKKHWKK